MVTYDVKDGRVLLLPVQDVGGSLKEYAGKSPMPFRRVREEAWKDAAREKASRADS